MKNNMGKIAKEYVETTKEYRELLDKYYPIQRITQGVPMKSGVPITLEALEEIGKAEDRMKEARDKYIKALKIR